MEEMSTAVTQIANVTQSANHQSFFAQQEAGEGNAADRDSDNANEGYLSKDEGTCCIGT